jgi:transcriptional regulator with XRE-family HTH domain
MDSGKRLKARRLELKLRVPEVAKRAEMGTTTLYDLERGTQVGTTKLHKLAKVLGLNIEFIESGKLPRLASDSPHSVAEPSKQTYHQIYSLGTEASRIGWEFQKLLDIDPGAAAMLGEMIELLVASKTRAQRSAKRKSDAEQLRESAR